MFRRSMSFILSQLNSVSRQYLPVTTEEDGNNENVPFIARMRTWMRLKLGRLLPYIVFLSFLSIFSFFAMISDAKGSPFRNLNHIEFTRNTTVDKIIIVPKPIYYFNDTDFFGNFTANSTDTVDWKYYRNYDDGSSAIGVLTVAFFAMLATWGMINLFKVMRTFSDRNAQRDLALAQMLRNADRANLWFDEAFQRRLRMTLMRRDFNGNDFELLQQLDDEVARDRSSRGARQDIIDRLPSHVITQETDTEGTEHDSRNCSICLGPFEEGETVRTLVCLHQFHQNCVDNWLRQNASCPICKAPLTG